VGNDRPTKFINVLGEAKGHLGGELHSVHVDALDNGVALHVQGLLHHYLAFAQLDWKNMETKSLYGHWGEVWSAALRNGTMKLHHGIQND